MRKVTVVEVCRAMRLEPLDTLMWRAGEAAREEWQSRGYEMEYELREKKNGGGTHQFAVYPDWFRPRLERIIGALCRERARQGDLFSDA